MGESLSPVFSDMYLAGADNNAATSLQHLHSVCVATFFRGLGWILMAYLCVCEHARHSQSITK